MVGTLVYSSWSWFLSHLIFLYHHISRVDMLILNQSYGVLADILHQATLTIGAGKFRFSQSIEGEDSRKWRPCSTLGCISEIPTIELNSLNCWKSTMRNFRWCCSPQRKPYPSTICPTLCKFIQRLKCWEEHMKKGMWPCPDAPWCWNIYLHNGVMSLGKCWEIFQHHGAYGLDAHIHPNTRNISTDRLLAFADPEPSAISAYQRLRKLGGCNLPERNTAVSGRCRSQSVTCPCSMNQPTYSKKL